MISCEIVDDVKRFAALRAEWNGLLIESDANTVFLTWEWLYTWWRHYGTGQGLFIIVARENGRLIGIAPLYLGEAKMWWNTPIQQLRFLGSGEVCSDYLDFIAIKNRHVEVRECLLRFLLREAREFWHVALFDDVPQGSSLLQVVRQRLSNQPFSTALERFTTCPYLALPSSWDDVLTSVSKQFRKEVRRVRRQLEEIGRVRFEVISDVSKLDDALDNFVRLHQKRWTLKGLPGSFASPRFSAFHRDVAHVLHGCGWLYLALLSVDGAVVAARYGFAYNGTIFAYQGGYDPDWSPQQVGLAVQSYCIEDEIGKRFAEHNFLRGTNPLKFRWTDQTRTNVSFRFGRADVPHALVECERFLNEEWKIAAKKVVSGALIDWWRSVRRGALGDD